MELFHPLQLGLLALGIILGLLLVSPLRKKLAGHNVIEEILIFLIFVCIAASISNPSQLFNDNIPDDHYACNHLAAFNLFKTFISTWQFPGWIRGYDCGLRNDHPPLLYLTGGIAGFIFSPVIVYKLLKLLLLAILGYSVYILCSKACLMSRILSLLPGIIVMLTRNTMLVLDHGNLAAFLELDLTLLFWSFLILAFTAQRGWHYLGIVFFGSLAILAQVPVLAIIAGIITLVLHVITDAKTNGKWNAFAVTMIHLIVFLPLITAFYWVRVLSYTYLHHPEYRFPVFEWGSFSYGTLFFLYLVFFYITRRQGSLGIRALVAVIVFVGMIVLTGLPAWFPHPEIISAAQLSRLVFPVLVIILPFTLIHFSGTRALRIFMILLPVAMVLWIFTEQGNGLLHETTFISSAEKPEWDAHLSKMDRNTRFWRLSQTARTRNSWLDYLGTLDKKYPLSPVFPRPENVSYISSLIQTPDILSVYPDAIPNIMRESAAGYLLIDAPSDRNPGNQFEVLLENNAGTLYKLQPPADGYAVAVDPVMVHSSDPVSMVRFFDLNVQDAHRMIFVQDDGMPAGMKEQCKFLVTDDPEYVSNVENTKTVLLIPSKSDFETLSKQSLPRNVLLISSADAPGSPALTRQLKRITTFLKPDYESIPETAVTIQELKTSLNTPGLFVLLKETYDRAWISPAGVTVVPTLRGFTLVFNPQNIQTYEIQFQELSVVGTAQLVALGGTGFFILYALIIGIWELRKRRFKRMDSDVSSPPAGKPPVQAAPSR